MYFQVVHKKTAAQEDRLKNAVKNILLFKSLEEVTFTTFTNHYQQHPHLTWCGRVITQRHKFLQITCPMFREGYVYVRVYFN